VKTPIYVNKTAYGPVDDPPVLLTERPIRKVRDWDEWRYLAVLPSWGSRPVDR